MPNIILVISICLNIFYIDLQFEKKNIYYSNDLVCIFPKFTGKSKNIYECLFSTQKTFWSNPNKDLAIIINDVTIVLI